MSAPFDPAAMHAWLDHQREPMTERITAWANINSGSASLDGLGRIVETLMPALANLTEDVTRVPLPAVTKVDDTGSLRQDASADALIARCRPQAKTQALLVIHFDTVYGPAHPFQHVARLHDPEFGDALHGPGVTDAKGGLAVMLTALEAFERFATDAMKSELGWTVVLNPDEETGSLGSRGLLEAEARRAHIGLLFEPALRNGDVVGARKGSGNFTAVVRGRAAHAGREFFLGRNAIERAAWLTVNAAALTDEAAGTTVNVARIAGGGANNVVPDLAVVRMNCRVADAPQRARLERKLAELVAEVNAADGFSAELHGGFNNPPKPLNARDEALLDQLRAVGSDQAVGLRFGVQSSGGVCDGNKLAAVGLPVLDSLGPVGRDIHSDRETLALSSLCPRAKLAAGLLAGYAAGRFPPPV